MTVVKMVKTNVIGQQKQRYIQKSTICRYIHSTYCKKQNREARYGVICEFMKDVLACLGVPKLIQVDTKISDFRPVNLCQRVRAAGNTKYLKCTNVGCDESVKLDDDYWPDCKPEGPLFSAEFVCLCVCVSDRHFYPSALTDFDET